MANHGIRKGKIGRLPKKIRDELNTRLQDGEDGPSILAWINELPETKSVLKKLFEGRPVTEVNLSEWRKHGYREWVIQQDALEFTENLYDEEGLGHEDLKNALGGPLVQWVLIQYAAAAKQLIIDEEDPKVRWARLRDLCTDIALLYRVQLSGERVEQEDYRIDRESDKDELELKEKLANQQQKILWMQSAGLFNHVTPEALANLGFDKFAKKEGWWKPKAGGQKSEVGGQKTEEPEGPEEQWALGYCSRCCFALQANVCASESPNYDLREVVLQWPRGTSS